MKKGALITGCPNPMSSAQSRCSLAEGIALTYQWCLQHDVLPEAAPVLQ